VVGRFETTKGTPLIQSSYHTRFWRLAKGKVGVSCRFQALRHTSVSSTTRLEVGYSARSGQPGAATCAWL